MSDNKKILITGAELHPDATAIMAEHGYEAIYSPAYTEPAELAKTVAMHDPCGIVHRTGFITEEVINAGPSLRVVSKHGVGVDNIDLVAAAKNDVMVINAVGANAKSVAEHGITLMLMAMKQMLMLDTSIRDGKWIKANFLGTELSGKTLGLIGFGAIARHMGKLAAGLEMTVHAFDPFVADADLDSMGVIRANDIESILEISDVVSLHCPLMPETHQLINAKRLKLMKPTAVLVNTARGGLIDEVALEEALRTGQIRAAGLDTFATEPPAQDNPLFKLGNVVITPHVGGVTVEAGARVGSDAVRGIIEVVEGKGINPSRIANKKELSEYSK